jgi:SulP family sulfate permease
MQPATHNTPGFAELFTPKLVTVLREGYGLRELRADALSGLTVAIVALPLSMAIAIASGVTPAMGLYTAIVGGFLVSALGGSRFQIGGPAGAFIVLVAATVSRHGVDGLILATFLSGVFLVIAGYARLGAYVKYIPYPVTVGFTAGIAVIIFASQLHEFFGLVLPGAEPGELLPKLQALLAAWRTANPGAVALAAGTVAVILILRRLRPGWPGMLIAVAAATLAAALLGLDVETVGSRFGEMPRLPPAPALPDFSYAKVVAVLPDAAAFALLGAIESLLSAVVADGMSGRRHRSNCELAGQGFANMGSALFGGFCVTGTIARTATNVRAGAHGPVSGMLHALFVLAFMLLAAPLAAYVPLAALAGVLVHVAWNMVEKTAIATLLRSSRGDAIVLLVTFLLVIFRDLTQGILAGFLIGVLLFLERMSREVAVRAETIGGGADRADSEGGREAYAGEAAESGIVVYRISGAFFFGAAASVASVLDRTGGGYRALVLDCSAVAFLDSTAANALEIAARKAQRAGVRVFIAGAPREARRLLIAHGLRPPHVRHFADPQRAIAAARAHASAPGADRVQPLAGAP